jgi:multidrug efflux pump subunit AcrB
MRVWLDPVRMTALGITASDVVNAIEAQNIQVAAGQIGQPPVGGAQQQQLTVLSTGRLTSARQFENIIVRTNPNGGVVRIGDLGRVELGAQQYTTSSAMDGIPSVALAVFEAPNANGLAVAHAVEQQMRTIAA